MRISSIQVKGLLGLFDHQIDLNNKLTIIYGENGVGKTMLFRLLNSVFNPDQPDFLKIWDIPFSFLKIVFDDEKQLELDNRRKDRVVFTIFDASSVKIKRFTQYKNFQKKTEDLFSNLADYLPLEALGPNRFFELKTKTLLSAEKVLKLYSDQLLPRFRNELEREILPDVLKNILNNVKIQFIKTQRLYLFPQIENAGIKNFKVDTTSTNYAAELAAILQEKTAQYRKKSDDLKNSLSQRIISGEIKTDYQVEELQKMAAKVNQKRKELQELGLLSKDTAPLDIPDSLDDIKKAILAVNILDMQEQLKVYEEDAFDQKVKLFLEILNERRFSYKKIYLSEEKGFYFKNIRDKDILPKNLSSGEQHELVLLYELLFRIPDASLILLDEPEISLHIAWQKEFIEDMQDIIALKNFDFIVSTHSPSIINGEWDLTISLKGPEDA